VAGVWVFGKFNDKEDTMPSEIQGSCACGTIRFTLDGEVRNLVNCHCTKCRKLNGGAFSSYAVVRKADLRFGAGEATLSAYHLPSGFTKYFCRRCGAPIYNANPDFPAHRMVFLGALERPEEVAPKMNIFCSTMLDWAGEVAGLTSFPEAYTR